MDAVPPPTHADMMHDPHHAKQKSTRFVLPTRLIRYFTRLHTESALVPVEVAGFVL